MTAAEFEDATARLKALDFREDFETALCDLTYCYHSLPLLGFDAAKVFEMIAQLSDPEFAAFVRAFVARRPADRSLEAFGLRIVQTPDGPVVEQWR